MCLITFHKICLQAMSLMLEKCRHEFLWGFRFPRLCGICLEVTLAFDVVTSQFRTHINQCQILSFIHFYDCSFIELHCILGLWVDMIAVYKVASSLGQFYHLSSLSYISVLWVNIIAVLYRDNF